MNKNTLLNQNYICPIGADGVHIPSLPHQINQLLINQQRLYVSLDEHAARMAGKSNYFLQLISVIRVEIGGCLTSLPD